SVSSGVEVFMGMAITYCAIIEVSDLKQCGDPILKLMRKFEDGGKSSEMIVNNVRFSYTRNEMMGNVFTVEPVE
ncbi:MAG: hypothetical protein QM690_17915, partial [Sphingobium sp.]